MTKVKQYVTWQRLWTNKSVGTDISANINNNWNYKGRMIKCTELGYGNTTSDKRLLAIIEYDDKQYDTDVLQRMWDSIKPWAATKITPAKAVSLCNEWNPSKSKEDDYFSIDSKDSFTIVDNTPKEEVA